ncbi:MAG: class I SAM-dependent methyltransferase [Acidobacteriota bacterium]|nr:class I SAM-dependent methyltransferase [Acidobacteriota bacterium]
MIGSYSARQDLNVISDERYFPPLARFDISFAHLMWIYDNVRAQSSVLDIGCAGEMLGVLKRKNARLAGAAPTAQRARAALTNGYDAACVARPTRLPFPDASFDTIVALDLLSQLTDEVTNLTLAEIKRVLRPGGVTLHRVSMTQKAEKDSRSPTSSRPVPDESNFQETLAVLFRSHFAHVAWRGRDAFCLSSEELLREADRLRFPVEEDFLDYLCGLSFRERRAFNTAMGYVYDKLDALKVTTPRIGFQIFVKASDEPPGEFDDGRRDRRSLFKIGDRLDTTSICLDRSEHATFDEGWCEARDLPPRARLMSERGRVRFAARGLPGRIRLDLITYIPNLRPRGITLDFFINNLRACSFTLFHYGWLEVEFAVPPGAHQLAAGGQYELEIRADRTWAPPRADDISLHVERRLSIAVCNLELMTENQESGAGVSNQGRA